ncbi:MAG: RHS repeat-associated core domain-containing protein [Chitinophagaceae bacterium]
MSSRKEIKMMLLAILIIGLSGSLKAQNLNRPNKTGPMGVQVNTLSGNVFIKRTDDYIASRGFNISLTFYYNSFDFDRNVGFGNGWRCLYSVNYGVDSIDNVTISWGDGREDLYVKNGTNYETEKGIFGALSQYQPGKFLLTKPDGTKIYFDDPVYKKISKMSEPNGNYLQFNYTDSLLTSISTTAGQSIALAYNAGGKLQTVTDAVASPTRIIQYTYNNNGDLTQVTDPLGGKSKYDYLVNGPMKSMTDKNKNVVDIVYFENITCSEVIGCNKRISFSYDTSVLKTICTDYMPDGNNQVTTYGYQKSGNAVWLSQLTSNCCGYNMSFTYDQQGNKTSETDANGNLTQYTYDAKGNVLTITDALGNTKTYTYAPDFNNMNSFRDEKGNTTTMTYDVKGNLIELTEPGNLKYNATYAANGDILTSTDPKGNIYSYIYDAYGNPSSIVAPHGAIATLGYTARGDLVSFTDAANNTNTIEYDILGRLKKITDPLNHNFNLALDSIGNVINYQNEKNQPTYIQYDASNRPVKYIDAKGNTYMLAYDPMDNITSIKGPLGFEYKYAYDTRNKLTSLTFPTGDVTNFSYDPNGNLTNLNLPNGSNAHFTYDAMNRVKTVQDGTGNISSYGYDQAGNVSAFTNGSGNTLSIQYDDKHRQTKVTDFLGNDFQFVYDNNDNITSVTDRNGHTANITYDSLNKVKTIADNLGGVISYTYTVKGNISSVKDQNNHSTLYTYDNLDRPVSVTYPDGRHIDFTYDNIGNITTQQLADGTTINYVYDSLNRIVSKTLPDGNVFTYTYDSSSRVKTATNVNGTVYFNYDVLNRLVSETFNGRTVNYSYSIAGRTQTTTYPDNTVVVKNFDLRNRLSGILKNNVTIASFAYDNKNNLIQKILANGTTTTYQYDANNRLISLNADTIQNITFTYDKEHNKNELTRINNNKSEQLVYDNNNRLIDYKRGPQGSPVIHNTYSYDALGNRTAANLNGTITNYTVNNINQITTTTGGSNVNFQYDNNGNLIFDGQYYKFYDAEKRLIKDSSSPSNVIAYKYDALNRRIQRSVNGLSANFTFSGILPIEERNDGGTVLNKTYFSGFLSPVMNEKNGRPYYFHSNELNSIEAITNEQGKIVEQYEYDVYGKMAIRDSAGNIVNGSRTGNRFGFTGQEFDTATGAIDFYFREYNPETGLFNQRDLIGYADGMGMYQYTHNNPANGVDVFGLADDPCSEINYTQKAEQQASDANGYGSWTQFFTEKIDKKLIIKWYENYVNGQKALFEFFKNEGNLADALVASNNHKLATETLSKLKSGAKIPASDLTKALKGLGFALNVVDVGFKANSLYNATYANDPDGTQLGMAQANFIQSIAGFTPQGAAYNLVDFFQQKVTGKSMNEHLADAGQYAGEHSFKDMSSEQEQEMEEMYRRQGKIKQYMKIRREQIRREYLKNKKPDCPQNNSGGNDRPGPGGPGGGKGKTNIIQSGDPNAMIGPDGQPQKHWISVKDRIPYTILYENSKAATAPAKYVSVTSNVEAKQDATTLQLASFGFNNLTFTVPPNTSTYSQRLDCRDSLGLYVNVIAGYDISTNKFFWQLQSIDPTTLLPPTDPTKGFLLLQDSTKQNDGHAFINFSVKPKQSAVTLDTISAQASIIFDLNDTIPTNRHLNTIDAFAPTTHLNNLPATSQNVVNLSWTGADDVNGCGVRYYTLYVSTDGINFNILRSGITRTDTTFTGANATTYFFFVLGTDSVGNTETLRPDEVKSTFLSSSLPVTWLYFKGKNIGKDNLLEWATGSEFNTREFIIERSVDGNSFSAIGSKPAIGNSNTTTLYEYTDHNVDRLQKDIFYYQLKQTDRDARFKYSNIVRLQINKGQSLNSIVYPNPTQGLFTIAIGDNALMGTEAMLIDETGRLLQRIKLSAQAQSIDISQYTNGIYFIRLKNKEVLKIIKQ